MTTTAAPGVRLSHAIQPIGALIAFNRDGDHITHVSAAAPELIGAALEGLKDISLEEILPRALRHELRNILSLRHFEEDRHFAGTHDMATGAQDVSISFSGATQHVVFEFEPRLAAPQTADDFASELRHLSSGLRAAENDEKLMKAFAALLRFTTGYDSALIYRLGRDSGEVIAEARNAAQPKLLGKRLAFLEHTPECQSHTPYPILHFVADAAHTQSPISSVTGANAGLDLTHCHLRGTPPEAAKSLAELGAVAAITVPLVVNGGVWGMALLLNRRAKTPSRYIRQLCDALAAVVSDRMQILRLSAAARPTPMRAEGPPKPDLAGKSVVVVEDNRLIAADLKLTLLDLGFETVDMFVDEASALEFLRTNRVDMGVLDILLEGDTTSFGVARKLMETSTPFMFASGYGAKADLPDWLGQRPVVLKPTGRHDLLARIDEFFDGRSVEQDRTEGE